MDCPGSGQISEDQMFTVSVFDQAAFDAVNGGAIEQAANGNGKEAVRGNGDPVRAFGKQDSMLLRIHDTADTRGAFPGLSAQSRGS